MTSSLSFHENLWYICNTYKITAGRKKTGDDISVCQHSWMYAPIICLLILSQSSVCRCASHGKLYWHARQTLFACSKCVFQLDFENMWKDCLKVNTMYDIFCKKKTQTT